MDLSLKILGETTASALQDRISGVVLRIGTDKFRRGDLAKVECFNFQAAKTLNDAVAKLKVKNTEDLFKRVSPRSLALPRLGPVAIAVLGAAFEAKGFGAYGGRSPLENWATNHLAKNQSLVTFGTTKLKVKRKEAA